MAAFFSARRVIAPCLRRSLGSQARVSTKGCGTVLRRSIGCMNKTSTETAHYVTKRTDGGLNSRRFLSIQRHQVALEAAVSS